MTLFLGIFISLIAINALLLTFSTTRRASKPSPEKVRKTALQDTGTVSLKVRESDLQKAG